ncbi:MAG TPA: ATP synthase F1 subunit epsilon [Candidatus Alistipes merdigallinarum]|nr:ATP synthase F1 subunit epsilon [Candidatus Alistipes merdigallinarum]
MMLEILSPEQKLFSGEVESVTLPGTLGEFTVLKRHAPLISSLNEGEIKYRLKNGEEQHIAIRNGFVEVLKNHVSVCIEEV